MKLSYLVNLTLLFLVLLLLWLNNQVTNEDAKSQTLSSVDQQAIKTIRIQRNDKQIVQLEKVDSTWQLVTPIAARANTTRVALLLNLLNHSGEQKLAINDNTDLTQYGLSTPRYSLFLNELQFAFGDASPIQKGRYVKHGQSIYVIDDAIAHLINSSANAFIDNRLIQKSLSLVKLELPNAIFELVDGHWQSSNSLKPDQVLTIIDNWKQAQALQVNADGKTSPDSNITLWFKETKKPLRLAMQSDKQNLSLYDLDNGLNYQFSSNLVPALFLSTNNEASKN